MCSNKVQQPRRTNPATANLRTPADLRQRPPTTGLRPDGREKVCEQSQRVLAHPLHAVTVQSLGKRVCECVVAARRGGCATRSLVGMTIEVMLESEVADAERAAVAEVFESAGIKVDIQAAYIRRGVGLSPWIIEIIMVAAGGRWDCPGFG